MSNPIVVDIATSGLPNACDYLDKPVPYLDGIKADGRLTDPVKIAADIEKKRAAAIADAEQDWADTLARTGLDHDLCRITAIGTWLDGVETIHLCKTEAEEVAALTALAAQLKDGPGALRTIITYSGHQFDLPVLMRRARYLGVKFPQLSTDRFRSTNMDLLMELSDRDKSRFRSLQFYARRLGMGLKKTLQGADEARVPETGDWAGLEASVKHDLEATRRLAIWMGVLR